MVKRLLSLSVLALTAVVGVQAQAFQANPEKAFNPFTPSVFNAPAKAASLEGTIEWSYSGTTSVSEWGGVGVGAADVAFDVAIFVPGDGVLAGASINGISVPVLDTAGKNYTAWVRATLDEEPLATVALGTVNSGLNAVALDAPQAIPAAGCYVGYSFTCSTAYPIAYDQTVQTPGSYFLQFNAGGWADYASQFGASPLKIHVSNVTMADNDLALMGIEKKATLPNSPFTAVATLNSSGGKSVESIDYTITVNGKSESKHADLETPIASGFNKPGTVVIEGTSPEEIGDYDVSVTIDKVNGGENAQTATAQATFKNLTKLVQRYTVVEEYTGTGCPWCTRGWAGMEMLKHTYDNFIGIAFHKFNTTDPMYLANYPLLGLTGAPGCVMDRKTDLDPYFGSGRGEDIKADFVYYNALAPEVDVTLVATYNEDSTSVDFKASTEFLVKPNKVSFVYVLTADGLSGTTTAWRQANNYAGYDQGGLAYLDDFCKGGKYGETYVYLTFDDVMIGSSYNTSMVNQGQSVQGSSRLKEGSVYPSEYTIAMPTKATLKAAINKDKVYAVVLVVDDATGEILNAAKTKVVGEETGINATHIQSAADSFYTIDGRRLTAPQRGVNIVRNADGSTRKVVVE